MSQVYDQVPEPQRTVTVPKSALKLGYTLYHQSNSGLAGEPRSYEIVSDIIDSDEVIVINPAWTIWNTNKRKFVLNQN